MLRIPFHKPLVLGKEISFIAKILDDRQIAGDGRFTRECARFLEERFRIPKVLMTSSCTAALEMAALLCDLRPDGEVIMPSFTFASTANAVARLGAKPVFVDVRPDTLNLDENLVEEAVTPRTQAIIPVHYAGVACELDHINAVAERHHLCVIEDAAQGVNAFYRGRALGALGHLGAYSFHETKLVTCGEGGALCINRPELIERAEILRDKGTNRQEFLRGRVDRYTWLEVGSSYIPSEILCAFLYAQLEQIEGITDRRRTAYEFYFRRLQPLEAESLLQLPKIPRTCSSNCHIFYVLLRDRPTREDLLAYLRAEGIGAAFHYVPLHTSPMGRKLGYQEGDLPITEELSERLLRLPLYHDISQEEQGEVVRAVEQFLKMRRVKSRMSVG